MSVSRQKKVYLPTATRKNQYITIGFPLTDEYLNAYSSLESCYDSFSKLVYQLAEKHELYNVHVVATDKLPMVRFHSEAYCLNSNEQLRFFYNPAHHEANRLHSIPGFRARKLRIVFLATGNDFRAVEAGAHAYASRNGSYASLSHCSIDDDIFKFWIEIPLALGTVGGLTALHPMAKLSLEMLQKPSARVLMQIMAAAGLAQNFAALRALTTKGIQHGHMKMHLQNILNQFDATDNEKQIVEKYFEERTVSHSAVVEKIKDLRKPKVNWVNFLNFDEVRTTLSKLNKNSKPLFGQMNAQQMIEHLSAITQIANGNWKIDVFVTDEKSARRKPFLDSENELQMGFRAAYLSDGPAKLKFNSIKEAIDDLDYQVQQFVRVFKKEEDRIVVHPFFGELDFEYWEKFQVKHFTHHFKQFDLL